jgi:hypothetical protein
MKASELRIGNYIADRGNKEWQIDHWESIDKLSAKSNATMYMGILMETHPMTEYVDYIKPIPLTKEWLLKFGFKQYNPKDEANSTDLNSRIFYTVIEDKQFEIAYDFGIVKKLLLRFREGDLSVIYKMDMKYVHSLQNLYFALTGEELKITQ